MLSLFTLNNVNYSTNIVAESYNVNQVNEHETWTDGDYITHKYSGRTRVKGSFTLRFLTESDFAAFITNFEASRTSGHYHVVTLRVNNLNTSKTINAFLSYAVGLNQKSNLRLDIPEFEVKVEEC